MLIIEINTFFFNQNINNKILMIKYNLTCQCGKNYLKVGFQVQLNMNALRRKKFISCIYCESTKVCKEISYGSKFI